MYNYTDLPAFLLLAFLIRLLATGASFGDALVILSLSALVGFYHWVSDKKEPEVNKAILDRIVELEESTKLVKDKVNSINFGSTLKR